MAKKSQHQAPKELSLVRKKYFFLLTLLFPVMFFILLEGFLRVTNIGTNTDLFITEVVGNKKLYVMNPDLKSRYFSHVDFSPNTSHDYFEMPKPEGTYRIFCLGGSTTVGFPYGYSGSFSTLLRQRLSATFRSNKIEVINLGMTATNSFTTLDILRELPAYQPDLIIIYDGHNEFYGALGVASHETLGRYRWLTNTILRLTKFKSFVLLKNSIISLRSLFGGTGTAKHAGTMMEQLAKNEYIPFGSELYTRGLALFTSNLRDIATIVKEENIPLILSTQASNLKDQPPFISANAPSFPRDNVSRYSEEFKRANDFFTLHQYDSTVAITQSLLRSDSLRADVHYLLAQAYDLLGKKAEARGEYVKARDYDELRFRTSSDFNKMIESFSSERNIYCVDIEEYLQHLSPDSLLGKEFILEHLHPNFNGYFQIAKAYAAVMKQHHLLRSGDEWNSHDTIPDSSLLNIAKLSELDQRAAGKRMHTLTSQWPFQPTSAIPYIPHDDQLESIADQLVNAKINWEQAHVFAAEYYYKNRNLSACEEEYRLLIDQLPYNVSAYLFLGQLYLEEKRKHDADSILSRSLDVEPNPYACRILGGAALDSNNVNRALELLETAVRISESKEDKVESLYRLAVAYYRAGDKAASQKALEDLFKMQPSYGPALRLRTALEH